MFEFSDRKISNTWRTIAIVFVILLLGTVLVYEYWYSQKQGEKQSPFSQYNLIYCVGDSDIFWQIEIVEGEIIETEKEEVLTMEAYDYKFYLLDTNNFSKEELTIEEVNKFSLITTDVSPDGFKILGTVIETTGITGLVPVNVFLSKGNAKKLIMRESNPVEVFRMIGWVAR